ncbi:PEP-CTERM sorting domain-containing protein [Oleiharenicola lentus]|uniref:PEP-CTERM sorting domain-containing protein n=1 Tax=Oleiharenicola lentus TaxID=2508720 RepID=UPI003F6695B5
MTSHLQQLLSRLAVNLTAFTSVLLISAVSASAQIAVSQITAVYSQGVNAPNVNGVDFEDITARITTFKDTAGNIYDANSTAIAAYTRRNTTAGNANNSSVWYLQDTANAAKFYAPYSTTYANLLLGNNLLRGSDNTFANGTGALEGNIERLDFVFNESGIVSSNDTAFAIFDRGLIGVHDSVKIAVITGWDSVNDRPTAYGGNLVGVDASDYGSTNLLGQDYTYNQFRYSNGDNLGSPYWNGNSETGTQGLGGTIISLSDLGIAAGTTIYGYSLMGYDVTDGGNTANLVNWQNTTYYNTSTTRSTGSGGIDLSAVNGVLYNRRVPEPSTYGAFLVSAALGAFGWRRWRQASPKR